MKFTKLDLFLVIAVCVLLVRLTGGPMAKELVIGLLVCVGLLLWRGHHS